MSWSSLTSNQMVSYTDAQGGGFSLNSGQSNVASNQCMTKNDAFTKYNLLATTNTNGLSSNQLMRKDYWVNAVGGNAFTFGSIDATSAEISCTYSNTGLTLYSSDTTLVVGSYLFIDSGLTTLFIPEYPYMHSGSYSYEIGGDAGNIMSITDCSTLPSSTNVPMTSESWSSASSSCSLYISIDTSKYMLDMTITVGTTILYDDAELTIPFNGGNLYYVTSFGGIFSISVSTSGLVTNYSPC